VLFQNTKCECGHQNHVGTVLCESCGKPLGEEELSDLPLEMRYDGVARRSQKSNPNLIDRVWNFFSSVKIAVYLIVLTLLGAMLGTILKQENAFINFNDPTYYERTYGTFGKIYYALGLSHTYESWWFVGLLTMIGTSLVICSLDRVLPLYRALNKQQIRKHLQFIRRQKVTLTMPVEGDAGEWTEKVGEALRKRRYRVHREGSALLAEKNRFSRWGPYINHIGLIIFLLAVLARTIPGWNTDNYVAIPEGDTVQLEGTNYYLKNDKFTVEYYKDAELPEALQGRQRAKLYETRAELYECTDKCGDPLGEPVLQKVTTHNIIVNSPLEYKGVKAYQFDFDDTPILKSVRPSLIDKRTGKTYGPFDLSIKNPELSYEVGPYTLELKERFMDFGLDENGKPITKSREPNAPAFLFILKGPELPAEGETYLYFPKQIDKQRFSQDALNAAIADRFEIKVGSMKDVSFAEYTTYLNIRQDKALPFVWVGASISMVGLIMGFYWHHRRIWMRIDDGELSLGAHTNKNWYGMRNDVAAALGKVGMEIEPKTLDNGGYNA
jgi:cytochrome c biogenesis protein